MTRTADAIAGLLRRAADSLDDARLLAEHRRHNEAVLTRLALHQALQSISLSEGLSASDDLPLATLLRRVPPEHPQAAVVASLAEADAQTIAAVASLIEALKNPPTAIRPAVKPAVTKGSSGRPEPRAATTRHDDADLSGPTALALSPQGHGRAAPADAYPSAAFWTLMDRWNVADLPALALIGHEGGLTKKGTRPRFRLTGEEAVRYAALRALDAALATQKQDPAGWLSKRRPEPPFGGGTALDLLQRDGAAGAQTLIRELVRKGLKDALR